MGYREFCKEDIQCKIEGQKRPFIDKNLQLQLPGIDRTQEQGTSIPSHHQIYSHYAPHYPLTMPFNENEVEKAMTEARRSYEAWKKMHDALVDRMQKHIQ